MKKIMLYFVILLCFFMSSAVNATEDSYICISDMSAGITKKPNGAWHESLIEAGDKYTLKIINGTWNVFIFGMNEPFASFFFGKIDDYLILRSDYLELPYREFSFLNNRFELYQRGLYISDYGILETDTNMSSFIDVGKCSKI